MLASNTGQMTNMLLACDVYNAIAARHAARCIRSDNDRIESKKEHLINCLLMNARGNEIRKIVGGTFNSQFS